MHVSKYPQKDLKQQQADRAAIIALAVLLGVFLGVALYAKHEENRAMRKALRLIFILSPFVFCTDWQAV